MNQTDRGADNQPSASPLPNVPASIGLAIAVAVLWIIMIGGGRFRPDHTRSVDPRVDRAFVLDPV
jgi:hypothetical protein